MSIQKKTNFFRLVVTLLLGIISLVSFNQIANADEVESKPDTTITSNGSLLSEEQVQQIDSYVTVENNQFVLNLPNNSNLTDQEIINAKSLITEANKAVFESNAKINPLTKSASVYPIQTRAYGKNDIEVYWNFVRVYLDKGQAKALAAAAISGGSTALGGFFGNIGGAAAGAAIGGYLASVAGNNINNGVWFDYNIYTRKITQFGWQ